MENKFNIGAEGSEINIETKPSNFFELMKSISHARLSLGREYDEIKSMDTEGVEALEQFKKERIEGLNKDMDVLDSFLELQYLI